VGRYHGSASGWQGEAAPRRLAFPRALIEDCGTGSRPRQSYARSYILRRLRQMRVLPP